jgi:Na+/proline symporter
LIIITYLVTSNTKNQKACISGHKLAYIGVDWPVLAIFLLLCKIRESGRSKKSFTLPDFVRQKYFEISNAPSGLTFTAVFVMLVISIKMYHNAP